MSGAAEATPQVRICKIAGRYLVFDADAASFLRRQESINGVLVGTAPQQPTQNIFLGLPIELRPEETDALVRRGVALIVDDVAAHRAVLQKPQAEARQAYLDSIKSRKQIAHKVLAEKNNRRLAEVQRRVKGQDAAPSKPAQPSAEGDNVLFYKSQSELSAHPSDTQVKSLGVTPTSSDLLISSEAELTHKAQQPSEGPLCRFLLSNGYYMTPGLRFGAKYSVYPGDPLRFHAHFMASQYDWNEEIPILELVAGGRLATAVKKAFLVGGEEPKSRHSACDAQLRTFSIEWAAM